MLNVVRRLLLAAAARLVHRELHGGRDDVAVQNNLAVDVAGRAANGLDQGALGPQKARLVGVQNGDQRDFWQVQTLAQQVDADQHVVMTEAQITNNDLPLHRVNVGVHIARPHALFQQVLAQVFGHAFGERGHQHPFAHRCPLPDAPQQILDLPLDGPHADRRIDQAGGPDNLVGGVVADLALVGTGCGRDVHGLPGLLQKLLKVQRAVIERRGQPEAVVHQGLLAGTVPVGHAADLRNGHVRLVDEGDEVVWKVVEHGVRRGPDGAPVDMPRVVLDAGTVAEHLHHLQVVQRALLDALGLEQFAHALEILQPLVEFGLDGHDGPLDVAR